MNFATPMMTPDEWRLCQLICTKPAQGDLLSDEMDLADECHMKLEEDDEVSIALKELKRERLASEKTSTTTTGHKRTPSDLTAATEAMSLSGSDESDDLSDFLGNMMVQMQDEEDDASCVDDVFRLALEYPCSDDENEDMLPLLSCS